ncbi:MAG: 30S ribosomal protein S24e [Methanomassiliicoccales archaeon PtaU1.Bin124]|nr:MAG: 30S ribosomal protein S24e [Methanomassiliicoccales archaeon PtaU1.Bin124]
MNFEIESKKQNLLQKRWEVIFKIEHKGAPTPKRDEMRQKVAEALNAKKEAVVIDHTNTDTGIGISTGYAKVYENVEAVKKSEKHYLLVRHGLAEKKVKVKKAAKAAGKKK